MRAAFIPGIAILCLASTLGCSWFKRLSVDKEKTGETTMVTVHWKRTPGNANDWVNVVPKSAPDTEWGRWTYLQSKTSGSFPVPNLQPGSYEARLYHDWPKGSYAVMERVPFTVE